IFMESVLDRLNDAFPAIHSIIFVIGVLSNGGLLLASFNRTPRLLNTYSVMIKIGAFNDLISVCCDFFTMQRMLVIPGNLIYLSTGPCSLISTRSCYVTYCVQLCTLVYSLYVMVASFAYRLWILHRPTPSVQKVVTIMGLLSLPPALVGLAFTFAQADIEVVNNFLRKNAPMYLTEPGALSGHTGLTAHLVFTILFVIGTPGPAYAAIMVFRNKVRDCIFSFVQALTIHAMLPPIYCLAVVIYIILFFDIKNIQIAAIPPSCAAFCTLYYVEPYRR
ncbi:hypothetical protein PFISCL1PPCAC_4331, partial [Pristionchus fissidentatus]